VGTGSGSTTTTTTTTTGVVPPAARVRYYLNGCTTSYTLASAGVGAWLDEVGWVALHGVNVPLVPIGSKHALAVLYGGGDGGALTVRGFGLTETEMEDFFPGPAFLAWFRMSTTDGPWPGPLPPAWRRARYDAAAAVLGRMRALGMRPALQGFAGYVPVRPGPRRACLGAGAAR